jgi:hypothetical protein
MRQKGGCSLWRSSPWPYKQASRSRRKMVLEKQARCNEVGRKVKLAARKMYWYFPHFPIRGKICSISRVGWQHALPSQVSEVDL